MGFGSVTASMQVVLRNNKKLLKDRKHFDKKGLGSFRYEDTKPEFNFPEATPQVLSSIKLKWKGNERFL